MFKKKWINLGILMILIGFLLTVSCSKKMVRSDAANESPKSQGEQVVKARQGSMMEPSAKDVEAARQKTLEEQRLREQQQREQRRMEAAQRRERESARDQFLNEDIHFEFDKATLAPEAQGILRKKAEFLQKNANVAVTIEGHCDERGTTEYNLALGERRTEIAKAFLINLGISASRLKVISFGEEKPMDKGHNETAWAKNRRAHFIIN